MNQNLPVISEKIERHEPGTSVYTIAHGNFDSL